MCTDTKPPETLVLVGPAPLSSENNASFQFGCLDNRGCGDFEFKCFHMVGNNFAGHDCPDISTYEECEWLYDIDNLETASHSLCVTVMDTAGNWDDTPARYQWIVDPSSNIYETVAITSVPADPTNEQSATFVFSVEYGSDDGVYECATNGNAFSSCSSPLTLEGLSVGVNTCRTLPCPRRS